MSDFKVVPAGPGEVERFIQAQVPAAPLEWRPVGMNWHAWFEHVGGYPTEQGTMLLTERGVFMCGMCGTFFCGQRRPDGTIDSTHADIDPQYERNEIILEYADPPSAEYTRNERGAIVLMDEGGDP